MIEHAFKGRSFGNTGEQAAQIPEWDAKRYRLMRVMGDLGSQVKVSEVRERDKDVEPYTFVRRSVTEIVFPPQTLPDTPTIDNSHIIDPTPGYNLYQVDQTWAYDEAQVQGHLRVSYDNADSRVQFAVTDVKGDSIIPDELMAAIVQAGLVAVDSPTK